MAFHLAVAGGVFYGVLFCAVLFSQGMSWMRSGIELSQFLRIFLSTFYTGLRVFLFEVYIFRGPKFIQAVKERSGPGCSKLTTPLVNVSLKDKVHEGSKLALSQKLMKFCYIVCVCLP